MLAHLASKYLPLITVITAPLAWIRQPPLFLAGLIAFGSAIAILSWRHDRRLCVPCAVETPLDGWKAASRRRLFVRAGHYGHITALVLAVLVLSLPLSYVAGVQPYSVTDCIVRTVVCVWSGFLFGAVWFHNRLQPWCPWCSDDGRGDSEDTPVAPDPEPARH